MDGQCLSSRERKKLDGKFRTKWPCDHSGTSEGSARAVAYAHPRFPPPSIPTMGDLLAAGQTHDAELSLCLIGGAGDQRRRGRPADVTICFAGLSEGSRLPASSRSGI
jgi:hypothetical protein